jgi:H/ACA ribonucleoprotein complex subunit 3
MDVYVNHKKIRLKPSQSIGKGGEADVYNIGSGKAIKVFKPPDHPDYRGLPDQQKAAGDRLAEHQQKLRLFPNNLPSRTIQPEALATDASGKTILGYTMPLLNNTKVLLKYSDRAFRQTGISNQTVVDLFRDLHQTVADIHQSGVVIGDFNDLNVLVKGTEAYVIDTDSFQYGTFLSRVFTARFVDPILCDHQATRSILLKPHSATSDWYAFAVMLMQSLLFVDPYGGVYKPTKSSQRIPHEARPLHRITVFHPEVRYPKPAVPYKVLSDDLLHYFYQVFEQDIREEFPRSLIDNLQWITCDNCGTEHARTSCPICTSAVISVVPITMRGTVTANQIFATEGVILYVTLQGEKLRWIYYDKEQFRREDDSVIIGGSLDPQMQFRIQGRSTLIGKHGQVITLTSPLTPSTKLGRRGTEPLLPSPISPLLVGEGPGVRSRGAEGEGERLAADRFDANEFFRYWIDNGQLLRDGQLGAEYIGDVLEKQTQFWVGSHFGFGFYSAGNLNVAFVFDAKKKGICDRVQLPKWSGQLIDATCTFTPNRCWFFWSTQERGLTINRCAIVLPDGAIEASTQAEAGDNSWLSTIYGKCAAGNFLFAPTDDGIVRVEPQNGQIIKTKEFPDTEPFVDVNCQLFASQQGLYVVKQREIHLLVIGS